MRKISNIFFLVFLLHSTAEAQTDTTYRLIAAIKGDVVDFTVDNLDNVYILNSTNQLKKYSANGDSIAIYNNIRKFGRVSMMDASNPLKLLLYYKDFSTIVILDRVLAVRNTIDLRKQKLFQVNAICQSYDNNIWLYDENDTRLKKIDEHGKVLLETTEFRLLFDEAPMFRKIFDQEGFVYLYDPEQFITVFDYYGALRNKILIREWQDIKVAERYIFGRKNDTLYRYDIKTFWVDDEPLPVKLRNSIKLNFTSTRLYALKKDILEIYSFR